MDPENAPGTDSFPGFRLGRISIWFDQEPECLIYQGTLSVSQRREITKVTPKKDADPHFIKNWRPLTLLKL